MSTRLYPLFQKGNPQLRVFLPNFWVKVVRPEHEIPENVVQFVCSSQMTKIDIKNYLEKIYNLDVVSVRTRNKLGEFVKEPVKGYIKKEDDQKVAYVTLPKGTKFVFPELVKAEKREETKRKDEEAIEQSADNFRKYLEKSKNRPGVPSWFTI